MNTNTKIAIGLLAIGTVLSIGSRDEKPLTPEDIKSGDTVSMKGLSRLMLVAGGAMLVYQVVIKKNS